MSETKHRSVDEGEVVTVVGAGLAGCMLSFLLGKRGLHVRLIEYRPDFSVRSRQDDEGGRFLNAAKRSINLSLGHRGIAALQRAKMFKEVEDVMIKMPSRAIHSMQGEPYTIQPYGARDEDALYSVSRLQMNEILIDKLNGMPNVEVIFDTKCTKIDRDGTVHCRHNKTEKRQTFKSKVVFGTDGAHSIVREAVLRLGLGTIKAHYLPVGYKELLIPPTADGKHQMKYPETLHVWPRHDAFMISMPNQDNSATCTLILPFEGEYGMNNIKTKAQARAFITKYFPDIIPMVPDCDEQFLEHPTSPLMSLWVRPWHYKDKVCILGDAAHAMTPFFGQGMNSAFEDCVIIDDLWEECKGDVAKVLSLFSERRIDSCHALVQLSQDHFEELGSSTGSAYWLLKRAIDRTLNRLFPSLWVPFLTMVSFSRTPYDRAVRKAHLQDRILDVTLGAAAAGATIGAFVLARKYKLVPDLPSGGALSSWLPAVFSLDSLKKLWPKAA